MSNKNWGRGRVLVNRNGKVSTLSITPPRVLTERELHQIVLKLGSGQATPQNLFDLFGYAVIMSVVAELLAQRLAFYEKDRQRFEKFRQEVEGQALNEAYNVYSRLFQSDKPEAEEKKPRGH